MLINPTQYIVIILVSYSLGFLTNYLYERLEDKANKYFYIKGKNNG